MINFPGSKKCWSALKLSIVMGRKWLNSDRELADSVEKKGKLSHEIGSFIGRWLVGTILPSLCDLFAEIPLYFGALLNLVLRFKKTMFRSELEFVATGFKRWIKRLFGLAAKPRIFGGSDCKGLFPHLRVLVWTVVGGGLREQNDKKEAGKCKT